MLYVRLPISDSETLKWENRNRLFTYY